MTIAEIGRSFGVFYTESMHKTIQTILTEAREHKITPGAVAGWLRNGQRHIVTSGRLTYDNSSPAVRESTVYDIASITKSIPVATLACMAIQEGLLTLDTKAASLLPGLRGKHQELVTIQHLLTYTVAWDMGAPMSAIAARGGQAVFDAIYSASLHGEPGTSYHYVNATAVVLAHVLERVYHAPLAEIAQAKVFDPLEMHTTTFNPTVFSDDEVAPTEMDGDSAIHKIVHDEGARALGTIGKTAGSAGLFSTVPDLLNFCDMLLAGGTYKGRELLTPTTIAAFQTNQLSIPGERATFGWDLDRPAYMGSYAAPRTFGKTGFTGCCMVVDIPRHIAMVLLVNAQYPARHTDRFLVNSFRARLADIIFSPKI